MAETLLEVTDLGVAYGPVQAVEGVSFTLQAGEVLGLVGESGSGKSTVIGALLRVLGPPAVITSGRARFLGQDLFDLQAEPLRQLRWRDIALVPQSALNALNPVLSIGAHFADTLIAHRFAGDTRARGAELLEMVGVDPVHLDSYPHELSGGMRQRAAIALALAFEPRLLILDEPTTALDVVVEHDILRRLLELQRQRGFAVLFITHDLSLLMEAAHRIGVLYSGRLVEIGPVQGFRDGGTHPYTRGLLAALPPGLDEDRVPATIPGAPPRLTDPPPGCRFNPRCGLAVDRCRSHEPVAITVAPRHRVACPIVAGEAP